MSSNRVVIASIGFQDPTQMHSPKTMMWSTHSRRIDPISRSAKPFCQGEAGAVGLPSFDQAARPKLWLDRNLLEAFAPHAEPTYIDALVSTGNYFLLGVGISAHP